MDVVSIQYLLRDTDQRADVCNRWCAKQQKEGQDREVGKTRKEQRHPRAERADVKSYL